VVPSDPQYQLRVPGGVGVLRVDRGGWAIAEGVRITT
jgi:hypothetical protein